MPENWVELLLALVIAAVCLGVPVLIVMVLLDMTNRKRQK